MTALPALPERTSPTAPRTTSPYGALDAAPAGIDVVAALVERALVDPGRPAVIDQSGTTDQATLAANALQIGAQLRAAGVREGDVVGLCLPRGSVVIAHMLGVLAAGAAWTVLDPASPTARTTALMDDADVRLVVTDGAAFTRSGTAVAVLGPVTPVTADKLAGLVPDGVPTAPDQAAPAYVIATSGTTGTPKAVHVPRRALEHFLAAATTAYAATPDDRFLHMSSLQFDASIEEVMLPLALGGAVVVGSKDLLSDADLLMAHCTRHGVTVLELTTAYWVELVAALERGESSLPSGLRAAIVGGESMPAPSLVRWQRLAQAGGVRLFNAYGPTETTISATVAELTDWSGGPDVPIGHPLAGVVCRVLDADGATVADGQPGELLIGGPGVSSGYLGRPEATADRYQTDSAGTRWFRTGDRVLLGDGGWVHIGRSDRQVKVRGFRVEPGEIESALVACDGVADAVVVADERAARVRLTAHVLVDAGLEDQGPDALRRVLADRLPDWSMPNTIVLHRSFPLTAQGKIDRTALAGVPLTATPEPSTDTSADDPLAVCLADLWHAALRPDDAAQGGGTVPAADDDFLAAGGDSLDAIRLVSTVRRDTGADVLLTAFMAEPTFAALLAAVRRGTAGRDEPSPDPGAEPALTVPDSFPLTSLQRHFWLTEHLAPDRAPQNLGIRFGWTGAERLDVVLLARALETVVVKHPALQCRIGFDDDGVPVLDRTGATPLPVSERTVGPGTAADEARRTLLAEPFDLESAPLARLHVLRSPAGAEGDELLLVVSHLVFDGWSVGVFADALADAYGRTPPDGATAPDVVLPPFPRAVPREREDALARRWAERLRGAGLDHALPADRPVVTRRVSPAARVSRRLDAASVASWRRAAREARVTPFSVLMAAVQTLVHRSGGRSDFIVLASVAGRNDPALHGAIGAALSVVPVRCEVSPGDTFTALVRRTHQLIADDLAHADLDLAGITAAAGMPGLEGPDGRGPVVVSMHNNPAAPNPVLRLLGDLAPTSTANHLTIGMETDTDGARLIVDYAEDVYDRDRVEAMVGHLLTLLANGASAPGTTVGELPMMPADERNRVLRTWNDSGTVTPRFATVDRYLEHVVAEMPEASAVTSGATTVTYRELDARANRFAHLLRSRGVSAGDRVAICLPRDTDLFAAMWGALKAGAAYVPLDPEYPADRLRYMLADSGARVTLTDGGAGWLTDGSPVSDVVVVGDPHTAAELAAAPASPPVTTHSTTDPAYVMYTSGSTGKPKGVLIGHDNLSHAIDMWQLAYGLDAGTVYQQQASFSFDMFVCETFRALGTGGRVVVVPREVTLDPTRLVELMRTERVQVTEVVPALLRALVTELERTATTLPDLRLLICGGEKWGVQDYRRARRVIAAGGRVVNAYGVTEGTADSAFFDGDVDDLALDAPLPIGRPFPGCRTYVLDEHLQPVPAGVTGELYLAGPGIGHGYLDRPELTAERFLSERLVRDDVPSEARLYRTGDAARHRRDGAVEFLGRLDDQVKVNGHRIELAEVESALQTVAGVAHCAVTTRPDASGSIRLLGYIVAPPGAAAPATATVRDALAGLLPAHMVPSRIVALSSLPQAPSGKVDRRMLPDIADADVASASAVPETDTEHEVAALWREVLGVTTVGLDDDFFGLGGDSFRAMRTVRRLDPAPTLVEFFQRPTVRGVAAQLERRRRDAADAGVPVDQRRLHRLSTNDVDRAAGGVTVVAVPYSGGSAVAYRPLAAALPPSWALEAVELPGHDLAKRDEPLASVADVADHVVLEMQRIHGPVVLYGHCLSVGLTLAIAQRAEAAGIDLIEVGLGAGFPTARPSGPLLDLWYRWASPDRFTADRIYLEYLRGRGGFSDIDDPADQRFILRALRHDERSAEEWFTDAYRGAEPPRLRAPVLSVVGQRDRVTDHHVERKDEWEHFATDVHQVVLPDAGHFFLTSHAAQLAEALVTQANRPPIDHEVVRPLDDDVSPADRSPVTAAVAAAATDGPGPSLRRFAMLATGQLLSMTGSALSSFVLGLWVLDRTGSVTLFAVITAIGLLPGILVGPVAGAVVDRFDRRLVMLTSDLVAGVGLGALLLSIVLTGGRPDLPLICVAVAVTSLAGAFQRPAFLAAVTQLVPKRYLGHTAGMTQFGVSLGTVVAPLVGTGVYAAGGVPAAVVVDVVTFFVGVVPLLLVRLPDRLWQRRDEPFLTELRNGWQYVVRRPGMRAALRFFVVDHALYSVGFAVLVPYLLVQHSTAVLGTAVAAGGIGGLLGALVMSVTGGFPRRVRGMLLFMGLSSIGMTVIAADVPALAVGGMFVMTFGEVLSEAHWIAFIQRKVGFDLQGRVLSIFLTVMLLTAPLGYLVVGPVAEGVVQPLLESDGALAGSVGLVLGVGPGRGLALLVLVSGIACLAWAFAGWRSDVLRSLDDELPDTVPDGRVGDRDAVQRAADEAHGAARASVG